jgi:hypothetical protein
MGSGEGVARTFEVKTVEDDQGFEHEVQKCKVAIFTSSEIDTMAALIQRQGATIESQLRNMIMGEALGFTNSSKETRTLVPELSYRACLSLGVQPGRAGVLLNGADGGTPQRLLWLPARDPDMADEDDWPDTPEPLHIEPLNFGRSGPDGYVHLDVPATVRKEIRAAHVTKHRSPGADPIGTHTPLTRLKVAAALMVLDGRTEMLEDDWALAGQVIDVSNATRAWVEKYVAERGKRANAARAHAAAERDEIVSERKLKRTIKAIERWFANPKHVDADGWVRKRDLQSRALKSDIREYLDDALAQLTDEGKVESREIDKGTLYRWTAGPQGVQR